MRDYEKRITATFLSTCSAQKAYEWLSEYSKASTVSDVTVARVWGLARERRVLEYLLLRRKDKLIDLGLAQFSYTPHVLRTVFARGTSGIRCAVLANHLLNELDHLGRKPVFDLSMIATLGNRDELEALALNPHLPNLLYEHLLDRTAYFAGLDELNYKFMLSRLGENIRLSTPYEKAGSTIWPWSKEHEYNGVFSKAWRLTTRVPATEEWAEVLLKLLHKAEGGLRKEEIAQTIARWQIDPPRKDDVNEADLFFYPGSGYDLRSRLADLLNADDSLLNAEDPALRHSFYRRFHPWEYKKWTEFFQKDGESFVWEAMQNMNLWKTKEVRDQLREIAYDTPYTELGNMTGMFLRRENAVRKTHTEWFYPEDDKHSTDPNAALRRMENLLKSIAEKLEK